MSIAPRTKLIVNACLSTGNFPKYQTAALGDMPITAKITDIEAWKQLSDVKHGTAIKLASKGPLDTFLVTARIPISQVETIGNLEFVKSLSAAKRLQRV
mmetsp:Transcript_20512/g.35001  ORF Transcript_20512/g.35001 Transcript_20512/m.35001 type:complete len:99 (-) Transcript_20512:41-337(-)